MARAVTQQEAYELAECGKRMADMINGLLAFYDPFEIRNCWLAFALQDGKCDGNVYLTMADAKRHADPWKHCYFSFRASLGGIRAKDCEIFLSVHRAAREKNVLQRNPDPDTDLIMSFGAGDTARSLLTGQPRRVRPVR
jgi:hypothetical protein